MRLKLYILFFFVLTVSSFGQLNNQVVNYSECGLDFIFRSIKITNRDSLVAYSPAGNPKPLTFTINELPENCIKVLKAYVWWIVSDTNEVLTESWASVRNPNGVNRSFVGEVAGTGRQKGWGENRTVGYRADVTSSITGNGNYTIDVKDAEYYTDGISLFIIYKDYLADYEGHLIINDGLITQWGENTSQTLTGFEACENGFDAKAFIIASDIQTQYINSPDTLRTFDLLINGVNYTSNRNFWNTEIYPTNVVQNQTESYFGLYPKNAIESDLYSWLLMGLYYKTTNCKVCPEGLQLFTAQSEWEVCPGEAVTLAVNLDDEYELSNARFIWSSIPDGAYPGDSTITVFPFETTMYYVTTIYGNDCLAGVDSIQVIVNPPPIASAGPDKYVCEGNSSQIGEQANGGTPPYIYRWEPNIGLSADDVFNPEVLITEAQYYYLTVTDVKGCIGYDTVFVGIADLPNPQIKLIGDTAFCFCNNVELHVEPDSFASYQWSSGETTSSIIVTEAGEYYVTVIDSNGCENTSEHIELRTLEPFTLVSLADGTIEASPGDTISLPLIIANSEYLDFCGLFNYVAQIRMNWTILFPIEGTPLGRIEGEERIINIQGERLSGDSLLNELKFLVVLGNTDYADFTLELFNWSECDTEIMMLDSNIRIINLCYEGGTRLFNPSIGNAAIMHNYPNPTTQSLTIDYSIGIQSNVSIQLFDFLGRELQTLISKVHQVGEYQIELTTDSLPSGTFLLVLTTDTDRLTQIIHIIK